MNFGVFNHLNAFCQYPTTLILIATNGLPVAVPNPPVVRAALTMQDGWGSAAAACGEVLAGLFACSSRWDRRPCRLGHARRPPIRLTHEMLAQDLIEGIVSRRQ
jgi:hypothetical protein